MVLNRGTSIIKYVRHGPSATTYTHLKRLVYKCVSKKPSGYIVIFKCLGRIGAFGLLQAMMMVIQNRGQPRDHYNARHCGCPYRKCSIDD